MQRFKSGDFEFDIPTSWAEVTLAQFMAIAQSDSDTSPYAIIAALCGMDEDDFKSQTLPFNASLFIVERLDFLKKEPALKPELPKTVTIDGVTHKLPHDLGAVATVGQMWDIDLVIRAREKAKQPVDSANLADQLLPVFLWPVLRTDPYVSRHHAAELLPIISAMPCLEALAVSAFFLRNFINPTNTGRISVVLLPLTRWKKWHERRRRAWKHLTCILPAFISRIFSGSTTPNQPVR
ncbi:hypothetical protein IC229_27535 [Spirosoma sp. BT702]|uniref:Uncharacterized protein n=1 Tax=Spirosoma profusum TaxID=2771354 RepID=A0A926Y0N6_9BACT|nr:hypothetical protein [Spirosoma profusum]MBD2704424.1 hypothetical protein [Spirosoma profusum]